MPVAQSLLAAWSALQAAIPVDLRPEDLAPADPLAVESPWDVLRLLLPVVLAVATALLVDRLAERRGELPPGFRDSAPAAPPVEAEGATPPEDRALPAGPGARPDLLAGVSAGRLRRAAASALLAGFFWIGVFAALGTVGREVELDLSNVGGWTLFALHGVIAATLLAWAVLAFPRDRSWATLARAFRLAEARPWREIGFGLVAGVGIWAVVLFAVTAIALALDQLGFEGWVPEGPPALVGFIAAQPVWVRLLGSLSAGFMEETFFRGFLQPRVGVLLSTVLFALSHWSYGEPFMLVGVTLLSLTYAWLARWRGSVWAAVTAHAVFDAVQLLIVIPGALKAIEESSGLEAQGLAWLLW